ncbi:MAG: serine/threonine protein kinase [Planctomycetes bacterium]|nr:serine/threonine protein kinase [Planctomycetota bacterium]
MPSYGDVVTGRLLLKEEAISPEALWIAVRDMAAAWRAGQDLSLRKALGNRYLVPAQALEATRKNVLVVERVERERLLARLAFAEGLGDVDALRAMFEEVRREGFRDALGARLVQKGLARPEQVPGLYERVDQVLAPARKARVDGLIALLERIGPQFDAAQAARVRAAFELAATDGAFPPPPPRPTPPAERAAPLVVEPEKGWSGGGDELEQTRADLRRPGDALRSASESGEIAPEDCPIYGYEIVRELGKGAMGVVYKARHVTTNRMTALKILPLRLAAKTQYLERFKREAMALMRIEHDNVVRAYDFGGSEDYYYLALEFVEGETLDKVLKRETCLPERRALELALQIARGLAATAGAGLVHRDVKPENVIVTPEGVAKLVDFGIVKLLDDPEEGTVTIAGTTVGTPFYISPEQARGEEELDIRSDLYALGITLFQLTTGKVPFTGKSQGAILVRHILEEVPDPRTLRPDLSEDLAGVVRKLTRKRREDRYASPQEVVDAISQVLAGAGAPAPTPV